MERRTFLKAGVAGSLFAALSSKASAQATLPPGDMTMVVPYPPGGISDARSRLAADWLGADFKRTVLVENVPGAAGIAGINRMKASEPNGLTVMSAHSAGLVVVPQLSEMDYQPLSVVTPLASLFVNPTVILVAKDSPYKTLNDVVADAKARPNEVTYATIGVNSVYHLMGEAINVAAGVKLTHVPYKGAAQYTVDLLAGRISLAIGTLGTVMGNKDEVRALAVGTAERSTIAPDVPTTTELGFPDLIMPDEAGLATHVDTPPEIVELLSESLGRMVKDEAVKKRALEMGLDIHYLNAKDFGAYLDQQYKRIGELIAKAGLKKA